MDHDDLDLEPMNRGRLRPIVLGIVIVAIAGGAAYAINGRLNRSQRADQFERAATAWNELRRCIVGEWHGEGGRASTFVRRIEIGLPRALQDIRHDERGDQWPFRCATHASVLTHALFEAHSDDQDERLFAVLASRAASALEEGQLRTGARDRLTYLDEMFEMATLVHLPPGAPGRGPLPPSGANPLSPHRMTPVFANQGAASVVATEALASATLRAVLGTSDRSLCVFPASAGADGALTSMSCHGLPRAAAPATIQFLGGDDDAPTLLRVVPGSGDAFLYRDDGAVLTANPLAENGYVGSNGRIVAILGATAAGSPWRVQSLENGAVEIASVAAPFGGSSRASPFVVGNQVITVGDDHAPAPAAPEMSVADAAVGDAAVSDASPSRVGARLWTGTLAAAVPASVHWEDRGPLGALSAELRVSSCRSEQSTAVAIRDAADRLALTFEISGRWSTPIMADIAHGTLTCRGTEATFTWIENRPHRWLHQLRCTPEHCGDDHGSFPTFPGDVQPVATDLDGNVLLVFSPGPSRGMQFVLAPLAELAHTPRAVLVFDDGDHGGLTVAPDMPVFVRRGVAAVLVSTTAEPFVTYAVRIDRRGVFAPLPHPGS